MTTNAPTQAQLYLIRELAPLAAASSNGTQLETGNACYWVTTIRLSRLNALGDYYGTSDEIPVIVRNCEVLAVVPEGYVIRNVGHVAGTPAHLNPPSESTWDAVSRDLAALAVAFTPGEHSPHSRKGHQQAVDMLGL